VLEGTLEEMMEDAEDDDILDKQNSNGTTSRARAIRQADFPGTPSGSTSSGKYEPFLLTLVFIVVMQGGCVSVQGGDSHPILGK
jgi:hypothetical protein